MANMNKTGRPKKSKFDIFRVQSWYYAVHVASGKKSAYALENEFSTNLLTKNDSVARSCIWNKYRDGKVRPQAKLVDQVEERFIGTEIWLGLILWQFLDDRTDFFKLQKWISTLDKQIFDIFLKTDDAKTKVCRIKKLTVKNIQKLKKHSLIDVLTFTLILYFYAVDNRNENEVELLLDFYYLSRKELAKNNVFKFLILDFLTELELHLIKEYSLKLNKPLPIIIFQDDPWFNSEFNLIEKRKIKINKHTYELISDATLVAETQVRCFEKYYAGSSGITIRLNNFIPIGLSILPMLDESLLLSFAKKFFEYIGNSDQIVMEKEVVILNAMKFGDIQDFNELIEVIGVAFLQEVYYFNSIKFNDNEKKFWEKFLGLCS